HSPQSAPGGNVGRHSQSACRINLSCPDVKKLIKRLHHRALRENRLDDANLDIIRQRQKTYEQLTKPLLNFYGKKLVHNVDSTQTPVKVLSDILRVIARL